MADYNISVGVTVTGTDYKVTFPSSTPGPAHGDRVIWTVTGVPKDYRVLINMVTGGASPSNFTALSDGITCQPQATILGPGPRAGRSNSTKSDGTYNVLVTPVSPSATTPILRQNPVATSRLTIDKGGPPPDGVDPDPCEDPYLESDPGASG